jgi:hypothetical protein
MGTWNRSFLNKHGEMFGVGMSWQHRVDIFSCTKVGTFFRQLSWETAEKIIFSGSWHSLVKYT